MNISIEFSNFLGKLKNFDTFKQCIKQIYQSTLWIMVTSTLGKCKKNFIIECLDLLKIPISSGQINSLTVNSANKWMQ